MKLFKSLLGIGLCLSIAQATVAQTTRNYNPIIPDLVADPSIVKFGDTFYCYATTDGYDKGLATSGPPVLWQSKDLVNWSFDGIFFPSAAKQLFWAPSYAKKVGKDYFFYPTVNTHIYVAKASSPKGPFKLVGEDTFEKGKAPAPLVLMDGPKKTKGIDAEIFIDDDKTPYLFWAQRGAAKLKPNMTELDGDIQVIQTKRNGYSEGPIFFKRKGIYYYMYTLSGHEHYAYAYQYSKVSPFGPYEFPKEEIIAKTDTTEKIYGPGHGNVFNIGDDYYFTYLEFGRSGTNRQVWINKMEFNEDGTIKPVKLTNKGVNPLNVKDKGLKIEETSASSTKPEYKVPHIYDATLKRTEYYNPANATDWSNGTRWMADANDSLATFTAKLSKSQTIKKVETYFVKPTAGHAYILEGSQDGKIWVKCGGHDDIQIKSPHTDILNKKFQYLRIKFLKGVAGIWEFKVQ